MRVPMLRLIKDRQNGPKQCVPSFCENNIFSVFSETQGVQLGTRAGTGTRGSGRVDQLPGYKFTTRYPNANYRMYK